MGAAVSLVVAVALAVGWPAVVNAQETPDGNALIDHGVERRRAGDDLGALALFTRAWETGREPRARAQMALAEQALGHFVDAEAHLIEALAANQDEWIVARRADLLLALEALQRRLGYFEIRGGIAGADLRIDRRSVGTLPIEQPIRIAAGSYRMEVVARGHYTVARQITIVPGGTTRETVVLTRTPVAAPSESDDETRGVGETGRDVRAIVGASLLGAGGVMLGTSAVMFGMRQHRANSYNSDACLVGSATRGETCGDLYDDTLRAQRASAVTLALGVALAGAGTLMFAIGHDATEDSASRTSAVRVACGASFGASWGAQCRLQF